MNRGASLIGKITVAVDGPAGSGKSSISKNVAKKCGFQYVDSGAIYRAITWKVLEKEGRIPEGYDFFGLLDKLKIRQEFHRDGHCSTYLNGVDISALIRSETIAKNISTVSDSPVVRNYVTKLLREWASKSSIIMDGRDIGTVVFPDAELKIYLDASIDERARRRQNEYSAAGKNVDFESIKNQIILRDDQDRSREHGALRKAEDAVYIDSTSYTRDEVEEKILKLVKESYNKKIGVKSGIEMKNEGHSFEDDVSMEEIFSDRSDSESGEIISGEVVSVDSINGYVYLNVGEKVDGRVPLSEFATVPSIGGQCEVIFRSKRIVGGMYDLSHKAAAAIKRWKSFEEWYNAGNILVKARIVKMNNRGAQVSFNDNMLAFLPISQAGDILLKSHAGTDTEFEMKITRVDLKKRFIFVSRRELVEERKAAVWAKITNEYKEGDVIKGKIVKFVEFGAFVDIGGFEALLHNNDFTWKKVYKRKKLFKENEEREFKILSINREDQKVSLGIKQLYPDPWTEIDKRISLKSVVKGEVTTVTNFGVFIEVIDGVEGLVKSGDISWTKSNVNPKNLFKKGQVLEAVVIDINKEEKKLALSLKHMTENPWDSIDKRIAVGSVVKGEVKKVTDFGIFVEIENEIDGMIHVSDVAWDDSAKEIMAGIKEGSAIEFKILSINKDDRKISCGIKQMSKSPWDLVKEKYPPRKKVRCEVEEIKSNGLTVKLIDEPESVRGFIHISEATRKRTENLSEFFKVGDILDAVVLEVSPSKKSMTLSVKHYELMQEKEELSKIMNQDMANTASIADLIKSKKE